MQTFNLYAGEDKGKPVAIVAPDVENAMTMVDAATSLIAVGTIYVRDGHELSIQGPIDPAKLMEMIKAPALTPKKSRP